MQIKAVRRAERFIGLAVLAGLATAAGAQETQSGVLVSAGTSVESNPYNEVDADGVGVAATAEIRPFLRIRDATSQINLTGSAQFRQFFNDYGLEHSYGLGADLSTRQSERVTIRASAGFNSSDGGYSNFGRPGLSPGDATIPISELPPQYIDPQYVDVSLLGSRSRINSLNFGAGVDTVINAYSSVSADMYGQISRFKSAGLGDFNTVGGRLAYSHKLSELTSVGLIGSVSYSDYLRSRVGDAWVYTLMASVDRRLGANWTASASGGVAFTRSERGLGLPDSTFTSLTAQVRLCRQGEFSQFCLSGGRSPQPTALGGVRVSNQLAASYSHRLSETERISLDGSYSRTGRSRNLLNVEPAISFYSAGVRYDKTLSQRLTGFASASFSKIDDQFSSRRANLGANLGVQYRFGALQ